MSKTFLRRLRLVTKLLSQQARLRAPAHLMRYLFKGSGRVVQVNDFDGCLQMDLDLGEHMQSKIFWMGYYCIDFVPIMNALLDDGMVVVDAGANIGEFSLMAGRRVSPKGRVYAFEPISGIADRLEYNITRNKLGNIIPVRQGLWDSECALTFYTPIEKFKDQTEHLGLGSVFRNAHAAGGHKHEQANMTTLDLFVASVGLSRLDMLKIDIEGAELRCIRGGLKTIRRFQPNIFVEVQSATASAGSFHPRELLTLLEDLGYRFYVIRRGGRTEKLLHLAEFQNVLCVPRKGVVPPLV